MSYPEIIQGGMGIGISGWPLARAVSRLGHLGVVSGAGQCTVFARKLQDGDIGGHLRRVLEYFPVQKIARAVLQNYYVPGGKLPGAPYKPMKMFTMKPDDEIVQTSIVANFAEVALAKEGHTGLVGINLLEKAQLGNLSALYGAMLAGVDYILMGAGIPREIPSVIDLLSSHENVSLKVDVAGAAASDEYRTQLEPEKILGAVLKPIKRPKFLAIVSSAVLARTLARKSVGQVDGFVVEGPSAGGHNAPPRGEMELDDAGQPLYGSRDIVDLEAMKDLGLPFWLAGSYGAPGKLEQAKALGATGIQVGTAFAFCQESGLLPNLKQDVLQKACAGVIKLHTDQLASPTGFPFKVLSVSETVSEPEVYEERKRVCDIGYLRRPYKREDGTVGYRCAAEPEAHFLRKGGTMAETVGRKCLCNGLIANLGLGHKEPALVTAGDMVHEVEQFLKPGCSSYSAEDVINALIG